MQKRLVSLDVIRCLAITSVVLLHTVSYTIAPQARLYWPIRSVGVLGVPLFVMLTGYLMADRDYTAGYVSKFLRRNVLPLLVAFEIWNAVYGIYRIVLSLESLPYLRHTLATALFADTSSLESLWYLPMCLALYLGMPLGSRLLKWASERKRRLMLVVLVTLYCGSVVPTVASLVKLTGHRFAVASLFSPMVFGAGVWGGQPGHFTSFLGGTSSRNTSAR